MNIAIVLCAAMGLGAAACGCAGERVSVGDAAAHGVVARVLPTGEKYAVYVPEGTAPASGWPCIVFLNGRGECGTDGQKQLTVGLLPAVKKEPSRWPFLIVFPQKPDQQSAWVSHKAMVMSCLAQTQGTWKVDRSRTYLTGLSQGGAGTWEIGGAEAGTFAAVAPVCGYGNPGPIANGLAEMPVWAFHGAKDDVVPPSATKAIVAALEGARQTHAQEVQRDDGAANRLRMTIYPDLNHGSWDRTYQESGVWAWLLRFKKE